MFKITILSIVAFICVAGYADTEIPDLRSNNFSLFQYLGNAQFETQSDSKNSLRLIDSKLRSERGTDNPVWVDAWYDIADKPHELVKMQFVKNENGWEFLRKLKSNQVLLAHPVIPFDGETFDESGETNIRALDYLTAVAFEADFQKQFPDKGCWVWIGSNFAFNKNSGIGRNRVNFKFGRTGQWLSWDYLMRVKDNQWVVERRLNDNERVNTRTGEVEAFVAVSGVTLSEAVVRGDRDLVASLLADGAKPDVSTSYGLGLLAYSIATGNEEVVDELIKAGADVNNEDHFGNTPVFTAALWGRTTIAQKLVQAGADVNHFNHPGFSPLDIASAWGNKQTEEFLKSVGAARSDNRAGGIAHFGSEDVPEIVSEIDSGLFLRLFGIKGRMNAPELTVSLSGEKGILPENQAITLNYERKTSDSPMNNINYRSKRADTGRWTTGWINHADCFIELRFLEETDGVLPGSIILDYPKANIRLKTEFKAAIKGLRIIDGVPDLRSDSMETLLYATKLYLEKKHNQKHIELEQAKGNYSGWFFNEDQGRLQAGGIDVYYEHDGNQRFSRIQLDKSDGIWSVVRELRGNQLFGAHPLEEVDGEDTNKYLQLLTFQRLELDLQTEYPDTLFRSTLHAAVRRSRKMAQVTVRYYLEGASTEHTRKYLLESFDDSWRIKRQLAENERLDTRNDIIEIIQ